MGHHQSGQPTLALPPLSLWMKQLLVGLFALFILETLCRKVGFPVDSLRWFSIEYDFKPFQLLTRFFIQGGTTNAVFQVLLGLLVLAFFLPPLNQLVGRKILMRAVLAGALGGTAIPLLLDILGILSLGPAHGWTFLLTVLVVLFGLSNPTGIIHLFLVFPVPGSVFVWGTLLITGLLFFVQPSLGTAEQLGAFIGTYIWWNYRGPGRRRRTLIRKAAHIEQELQLLQGGKDMGPDYDA